MCLWVSVFSLSSAGTSKSWAAVHLYLLTLLCRWLVCIYTACKGWCGVGLKMHVANLPSLFFSLISFPPGWNCYRGNCIKDHLVNGVAITSKNLWKNRAEKKNSLHTDTGNRENKRNADAVGSTVDHVSSYLPKTTWMSNNIPPAAGVTRLVPWLVLMPIM